MNRLRMVLNLFAAGTLIIGGVAQAGVISLNFSENSGNQGFAGEEMIGPLNTNSTFWNTTNGQPDLVAGSMSGLIDDSGADTGASVTWTSSNVWWNADGTADDQHKLAVGYLDDGNTAADPAVDPAVGIQITVEDVPYATYRVYGLLASDQNGDTHEYETRNFKVNTTMWAFPGGEVATAPAYGTIDTSQAATGEFWTLTNGGTQRGNYWTRDTSGSTLTIIGPVRDGANRASLTGLIIEEIPEPGSLLLLVVGSLLLFAGLRRRG
jgi:hypothetical protein